MLSKPAGVVRIIGRTAARSDETKTFNVMNLIDFFKNSILLLIVAKVEGLV